MTSSPFTFTADVSGGNTTNSVSSAASLQASPASRPAMNFTETIGAFDRTIQLIELGLMRDARIHFRKDLAVACMREDEDDTMKLLTFFRERTGVMLSSIKSASLGIPAGLILAAARLNEIFSVDDIGGIR
ncbi:hypothetical protein PV11_08426 [Exophiala sideris]|uniref:Uncharacterized protein n=1 Tax=Exophiala sideris TaxID=1016849 RepID=A0A0D1YIZ5_9EURO|nr:hypothetical protein PV11_08426 [Exophiala sideris]